MSGIAPLPRKRRTLREQLDRIVDLPDEDLIELMDELEADEQFAKGHRHHAPKTQYEQDRDLKLYIDFVMRLPRRQSGDDPELVTFPNNLNELYKLLRLFLMYVFKTAVPRSGAGGQRIQYSTLSHYRDHLIFWVNRIFEKRDLPAPPRTKLFNQMTEAMRSVQARYGDRKSRKTRKTYLGLAELRQLIDAELFNNRSIENSEQHQVIWCIGRICAIRPGTIGISGKYGRWDPLRWSDLKFVAGQSQGTFTVEITFNNILIKARADPEVGRREGAEQTRPLVCRITSPSQSNIIFSVPHRLLTIAIRRNLLVDISSIPQLMASELHNISIKPQHLNDPVFYRSVPKGTGLDPPHSLSARSMSDYLTARGAALGYGQTINFYSIRRRAATDLVRRVGVEATRVLMGHTPESRTLERYYLDMTSTFDVSAAGLEEPIAAGAHSESMVRDYAPLALSRLDETALRNVRGAALSVLCKKMARTDPDFPQDASEAQLKLYRRRIRYHAKKVLIQQQQETQQARITQQEYSARQQLLEASKFADEVFKRARETMDTTTDTDMPEVPPGEQEEEEEDDDDAADGFGDADEELEEVDAPEADLDENVVGQGGENFNIVDRDIDEDQIDEGEQSQGITYTQLAISFMETLMENSLSGYTTWADQQDKRCPLCVDDATVPLASKAKEWSNESHLILHMSSQYHAPRSTWRRRMKALANERPDHRFVCPYCPSGSAAKSYTVIQDLERHIRASTEEKDGLVHEKAKADDGWFDPGWVGTYSDRTYPDREARAQQAIRDLDIHFTIHEPELLHPAPHATRPGVVHGYFGDDEIPPHLQGLVHRGQPAFTEIPPHLQGVVRVEPVPPNVSTEIPERFRGLIKVEQLAPKKRKIDEK